MPNIFTRIFGYAILERELSNRIADRDAQIVSLKVRIEDLENRLFLVRGVPVKGAEMSVGKGVPLPAYRTARQRMRDMVTPAIGILSADDEKAIEDSLTQ